MHIVERDDRAVDEHALSRLLDINIRVLISGILQRIIQLFCVRLRLLLLFLHGLFTPLFVYAWDRSCISHAARVPVFRPGASRSPAGPSLREKR